MSLTQNPNFVYVLGEILIKQIRTTYWFNISNYVQIACRCLSEPIVDTNYGLPINCIKQ